jgi:hypothetical protein
VTTTPLDMPDEQRGDLVAARHDPSGQGTDVPDVAGAIREFNASNHAHEDLWARTRQAADAVRHAIVDRQLAQRASGEARDSHLAIQAEHPHRRASLMRQALIALATVALDAVACWFAAQALGSGQLETLLWAGLFLVVLAGGEIALDFYSEHSRRAWQAAAAALAAFVAGLGVLRYLFLATVGTDGTVTALVGAVLFTAVTAVLVMIGYRALRAAESFRAWQARRRARRAAREASAAGERLARRLAERDRLIDAYVARIRVSLVKTCTSALLARMEAAIRVHLTGRDGS